MMGKASGALLLFLQFCEVDMSTGAFLSSEAAWFNLVRHAMAIWEVMPALFFYCDPEEAEKEEAARVEEVMAIIICIHDFPTIAISGDRQQAG